MSTKRKASPTNAAMDVDAKKNPPKKKTKGRFFGLEDLSHIRTYAYDEPTVVGKGRFTDRKKWIKSSTFWDNYVRIVSREIPKKPSPTAAAACTGPPFFPFASRPPPPPRVEEEEECGPFVLEEVDLSGLAIFGGSIVDTLLSRRNVNDVDIAFFCDAKDPLERGRQLAERVKRLVEDIGKAWRQGRKREKSSRKQLLVTRRHSMYEILHPGMLCPLQVVVKENLASLLDQSEGYTSIAYFDGRIHMTERAKFALENFAVPVDVHDRPHRIVKCFNRGFDLILPELKLASLRKRNLRFGLREALDLPYITIVYDKMQGNKVFACEVVANDRKNEKDASNDSDESDSSDEEHEHHGKGLPGYREASRLQNVGEIIHHNIRALVRKEHDNFIHFGEGESWETVYSTEVPITERALINSYETVCRKISARRINLPIIESYFGGDTLEIVNALLIKFYQKNDRKTKSKGMVFSSEAFDKHVASTLDALREKQIKIAKKAIVALKGTLKLSALTYKQAQTTCSSKKWYGDYHRSQ